MRQSSIRDCDRRGEIADATFGWSPTGFNNLQKCRVLLKSFMYNERAWSSESVSPDVSGLKSWVPQWSPKEFCRDTGAIFSIGDGTQYGQSFALDWGYTAADKFTIKQGDGTGYPISITTGSTYAANTWYHVAVSCTATGLRAIYINGIGDGGYMTSSPVSSSDNWVVNGFNDNNGIGNNGSTSYVSNLRIVVGTALYTSNFTPPYAALVPITNTQLLLCMSDNGGLLIDSSPNNFKVQVVGTPGASGSKPFTVNTVQRQLNTGTLQVSGYFDEETGIV